MFTFIHTNIHGLFDNPLVVEVDFIAVVVIAVALAVQVVHVVEVAPAAKEIQLENNSSNC